MRTSIVDKALLYKDILVKYNYDFKEMIQNEKLSESFIDNFFYHLKPYGIEKWQDLTRYLILKYQNALNWQLLSIYQILDEDIIELKYKEVNWSLICENQKLSLQFLKKWRNYIDFFRLLDNLNFSDKEIQWIQENLKPIK